MLLFLLQTSFLKILFCISSFLLYTFTLLFIFLITLFLSIFHFAFYVCIYVSSFWLLPPASLLVLFIAFTFAVCSLTSISYLFFQFHFSFFILQTCQQLRSLCSCYELWANATELQTRKTTETCFCKVQNSSFAGVLLGVKNCFSLFTWFITYVHVIFQRITYSSICGNPWIIVLIIAEFLTANDR